VSGFAGCEVAGSDLAWQAGSGSWGTDLDQVVGEDPVPAPDRGSVPAVRPGAISAVTSLKIADPVLRAVAPLDEPVEAAARTRQVHRSSARRSCSPWTRTSWSSRWPLRLWPGQCPHRRHERLAVPNRVRASTATGGRASIDSNDSTVALLTYDYREPTAGVAVLGGSCLARCRGLRRIADRCGHGASSGFDMR